MKASQFFQFLVPKDTKFFPVFIESADNLVLAANAIDDLIRTYPENLETQMIRIKEIEHAADAVTHQIFDFLNTTFITPFDREDIITLAKEMDDVVDYINAAAQKIHLYKPKNGLKQYEPFCEMIKECTNEIRLAVVELPSIKNPKTLERICIRINEIENHTDLLFDKTISRLFETETDAVELIKHKEITQTLEKVTDSAERVADAIKRIIVKLA